MYSLHTYTLALAPPRTARANATRAQRAYLVVARASEFQHTHTRREASARARALATPYQYGTPSGDDRCMRCCCCCFCCCCFCCSVWHGGTQDLPHCRSARSEPAVSERSPNRRVRSLVHGPQKSAIPRTIPRPVANRARASTETGIVARSDWAGILRNRRHTHTHTLAGLCAPRRVRGVIVPCDGWREPNAGRNGRDAVDHLTAAQRAHIV